MVIDPWELYLELGNKDKCTNCDRELPNKNMKTKNGCLWCDALKENKNGQK